jgi:hypothetical protein
MFSTQQFVYVYRSQLSRCVRDLVFAGYVEVSGVAESSPSGFDLFSPTSFPHGAIYAFASLDRVQRCLCLVGYQIYIRLCSLMAFNFNQLQATVNPIVIVPAGPGQPNIMKPECTVTHSEEGSVARESLQEQYETRKINLRTGLGLLVYCHVNPPATSLTTLQALAVTYESCLLSFILPVSVLLSINSDIGPSNNIAWMATAWSLSSAVIMTIAGRLSDILGRRNFFLAGNLLGSIGCAVSARQACAYPDRY